MIPHDGPPDGVALSSGQVYVAARPGDRVANRNPRGWILSEFFAMKLLHTAKTCVLSLAIVPLVGASFDFGLSRWIVPASAAFMLLAIAILVGVQTARSRREYRLPPVTRAEVGDRVSNRLVVLSSAAVLAVYSTGYFRTRSAANELAERVARQVAARTAPVIVPAPSPAPAPSSQVAQSSPLPRKSASSRSPSTSGSSGASGDTDPRSTSDDSRYGIGTAVPAPPSASSDSAAEHDPDSANYFGPSDYKPGARLKDGRYQGRGTSPHGDIVAEVVIQRGQIVYSGVAQCLTRYSCSVIKELPEQVVIRQSTDVDVVSGASESTSAFQDGVASALGRSQAAFRAQ